MSMKFPFQPYTWESWVIMQNVSLTVGDGLKEAAENPAPFLCLARSREGTTWDTQLRRASQNWKES